MSEPRHVGRCLHVRAEVEEVDERLCMALRLHVTAHQSDGHQWPALLHDEARGEGVERPLVRRDRVGLFGSSEKRLPRLCSKNPKPGTVMPEPNVA